MKPVVKNLCISYCKVVMLSIFFYLPIRIHFDYLFDRWFNWCHISHAIGINCLDILFMIIIIKMIMKVTKIHIYYEKRKARN